MTETREKLSEKADKISQFLKLQNLARRLLENVKTNLLRYPDILNKLTGNEHFSPELEKLRNTLSVV